MICRYSIRRITANGFEVWWGGMFIESFPSLVEAQRYIAAERRRPSEQLEFRCAE